MIKKLHVLFNINDFGCPLLTPLGYDKKHLLNEQRESHMYVHND